MSTISVSYSDKPASEAGAINGYSLHCSECGVWGSNSMLSSTQLELASHLRWHESKKAR